MIKFGITFLAGSWFSCRTLSNNGERPRLAQSKKSLKSGLALHKEQLEMHSLYESGFWFTLFLGSNPKGPMYCGTWGGGGGISRRPSVLPSIHPHSYVLPFLHWPLRPQICPPSPHFCYICPASIK